MSGSEEITIDDMRAALGTLMPLLKDKVEAEFTRAALWAFLTANGVKRASLLTPAQRVGFMKFCEALNARLVK